MKRPSTSLLFLISVTIIVLASASMRFALVDGNIHPAIGYSDIRIFYITDGQVPYIDYELEYPVITGMLIYSASIFGGSQAGYFILSSIVLFGMSIAAAYLLLKIAKKRKIAGKRLVMYFALTFSLLFFSVYNWDILAVGFTVFALYFFENEKPVHSGVALALGASSKFFPVIFLIPLLVKSKSEKRPAIFAAFVVTFIIINGFFIAANPSGWMSAYTFHSGRGPNIDSFWGIIDQSLPGNTSIINLASFAIMGISYLLVNFKLRKRSFIELCAASVLIFLLTSKVFSPQFSIWMLPFFALLPTFKKRHFYSFEITNIMAFLTIMFWYHQFHPDVPLVFAASMGFILARHIVMVFLLRRISTQESS